MCASPHRISTTCKKCTPSTRETQAQKETLPDRQIRQSHGREKSNEGDPSMTERQILYSEHLGLMVDGADKLTLEW